MIFFFLLIFYGFFKAFFLNSFFWGSLIFFFLLIFYGFFIDFSKRFLSFYFSNLSRSIACAIIKWYF
ncbi:hypothetical protein BHU51_07535 [Helicobacter pylori]|nr:hypothetical protein BHU51_07535 [Helicobacter pylori]OLR43456.1 hypothetical protein BIZ45_07530 [Helicobacter pylori]